MGVPNHQHALARILTPIILGTLLLGAAGCGTVGSASSCGRDAHGLPTCPVSNSFIQAQPEASLVYPGSTVISRSGSGEAHYIGSTNPADAGVFAATTAPMTTVDAWYQGWLTSHGWRPAQALALGPIEISSQAYAKDGRESFVVGASDLRFASLDYKIPTRLQSQTLYDTTFIIEPYKNAG